MKNIIKIVTIKSKILHNITLTCSFMPFSIPSTILSIYIKITKKESIFIHLPTSILSYIAILISFAKKKKIPITKTENIEVKLKTVLQTFFILFKFFPSKKS